ncbi:MAG: hypothetical protein GY711_27505 [bacterium]|nr:hypothetical protein [bacterium]
MSLRLETMPLGRLVLRPRALLGAAGVASFMLGIGWIGSMARFNNLVEPHTDPEFVRILLAAAVVLIPATVGAFACELLHEVLSASATAMLPGIVRRLRASVVRLGILASVLVALGLSPWLPGAYGAAGAGPALLGFAVGSWAMTHTGSGVVGAARTAAFAALIALAYFAAPLLETASAWSVNAGLALLAAALIHRRFREPLLRASMSHKAPTMLSTFFAPRRARQAREIAFERAPLPPARLGRSLSGWVAACWYERRTTRSRVGTPYGTFCLMLLAMAVSLVAPALAGILESPGSAVERLRSLTLHLTGALVGEADPGRGTEFARSSIVIVLGMAAEISTLIASAPLASGVLYPISRPMRARLAFRSGLAAALTIAAATLVAGTLVGGALLLLGGHDVPRTLPVFAWVALANLLIAPWIQIGVSVLPRFFHVAPSVAPFALIGGLMFPLFVIAEVLENWSSLTANTSATGVATAYVVGSVAGFLALRAFTGWDARTMDLVRA